jgi:Ca2+-binding RTX toxin-like protein
MAASVKAQQDPRSEAAADPADMTGVDRTRVTFVDFADFAEDALTLEGDATAVAGPTESFLSRMPPGSIDSDALQGVEVSAGGGAPLTTYCVGSEGADTIMYGELECMSISHPTGWVDYGRACCVYAFDPAGPCWRGALRWAATVWGTSPTLPLVVLGDPTGGAGADYIMYSSYCGETTVSCSYPPGGTCRLRTVAPNPFPTDVTMGVCGDACGANGGADGIAGWVWRDQIYGNGGGDVIYGLAGSDYIDGGPGSDLIAGMQCDLGQTEQIVGGNADAGGDFLYGYWTYQGGNACVRMIDGGPGRDFLYGGPGDDYLYGMADQDDLYGYEGYDRCDGGTGGVENDYCEPIPGCDVRLATCELP